MFTNKKFSTSKNNYWITLLLALGVLILTYGSNVAAENIVPQKERALDIGKTPLKIDQMNLIDRSDLSEESQTLPPNIIRKSDNNGHSEGNLSILFLYIVLGFLACLSAYALIYIIHDHMVLSRRKWIQRYAEPEYD